MADYYFGEISGQTVGKSYKSRVEAKDARVHQVTQQGIAGNRDVGCASIVLSGGYSTDEDYGHEIFYTEAGGQHPNDRSVQVAHQDLTKSDNAALVRSEESGMPIRIVRGAGHHGDLAPSTGYRYDGLYKVIAHFEKLPPDGFRRWMFHLVQLSATEAERYTPDENYEANKLAFLERGIGSDLGGVADSDPESSRSGGLDLRFEPFEQTIMFAAGNAEPNSRMVITQRTIRDTRVTAAVKAMYASACQVCQTKVLTIKGFYSEGAHIRPLGRPHHGPDTMDNILCLCPNHHASFDGGGFYLRDDLKVVADGGEVLGSLHLHGDHIIDLNNVRYHRNHHGHALDVQP